MSTEMGELFRRVTRDNEDTLTELLCHLMRRGKYLRDTLLEWLGVDREYAAAVTPGMIHNRKALAGAATKPDIAIGRDSRKPDILVEAKDGASLMESQVTTYPEAVKSSKSPHRRMIYLVRQQCAKEDPLLQRVQKQYEALVVVRTWEQLLDHLRDLELAKGDALVAEIVNYIGSRITPLQRKHVAMDAKEALMLNDIQAFATAVRLRRNAMHILGNAMAYLWSEEHSDPKIFWASNNNWGDLDDDDPNLVGKFWRYNSINRMNVFTGFDLTLEPKDPNSARFFPAVRINRELIDEDTLSAKFKPQEYFLRDDPDHPYCYFALSKYSMVDEADCKELSREIAAIFERALGLKLQSEGCASPPTAQ